MINISSPVKKIIFYSLGILAIIYIGFIFNNNFESIDSINDYIRLNTVFISLIPATLMLLSKSYLNTLILEDIENIKLKEKINVISIYSNSQIIRYLPGKVFGIIYQGEKLSSTFSRRTTWFSNIIQMAITNANSIIILGTIYLYISEYKVVSIIYLLSTLFVLLIIIKNNTIYKYINSFISKKYRLSPNRILTTARTYHEILLLQLDWVFYFSVWYFLFPTHLSGEFIIIGATYAAASLLGMLAFVMPSGWLVREASFIWLGGIVGISHHLLLIYSVISRMFFILADLTFALILSGLSKIKKKESGLMNQQQYWDNMAKFGVKASVIDPSDTKGYKNQYIVELRNSAILNALKHTSNSSILDFGCGTGNLSELLSEHGYKVSGLDISSELLKFAEQRQGATSWNVYQYDGMEIPFDDNSLDAIVTYVVLNHILDDDQFKKTIDELYRVLKPGGQIIAVEQVSKNITISSDKSKKQRPLKYFTRIFIGSGLKIQSHKTIRRGHFPFLYAIRFGFIPVSFFKYLAKLESLIGRFFKEPLFDYADVIFILKK